MKTARELFASWILKPGASEDDLERYSDEIDEGERYWGDAIRTARAEALEEAAACCEMRSFAEQDASPLRQAAKRIRALAVPSVASGSAADEKPAKSASPTKPACVWCEHVEPHTKHGVSGCVVDRCTCFAYERMESLSVAPSPPASSAGPTTQCMRCGREEQASFNRFLGTSPPLPEPSARETTPAVDTTDLVAAVMSAFPAGFVCVRLASKFKDECEDVFFDGTRCPQCRIYAWMRTHADATKVASAPRSVPATAGMTPEQREAVKAWMAVPADERAEIVDLVEADAYFASAHEGAIDLLRAFSAAGDESEGRALVGMTP